MASHAAPAPQPALDESVNIFVADTVDQDWSEQGPARAVSALVAAGQEAPSIHQIQREEFGRLSFTRESDFDALWGRAADGPPPAFTSTGPLQKRVVGWHPYWMGTTYTRYNYSALSTIAFFSYEVNPASGSYLTLRGWDTTPLVAWAQSNNVKAVLTATCFGLADNRTLLTNAASCQNLINTLVSVVSNRGGHGVNIDFEGISDSSLKAPLTSFLSNLAVRFHRDLPGSEVSIALPAVDWSGVFDVGAYNQFLDYCVIMGYDYHWKGGPRAGPVAPLSASATWGAYCVEKSVDDYLAKGISASKLLLGNPYYGYDWPTTNYAIPSGTRGAGSAVLYPNALANAATYGRQWNEAGGVPYYFYTNSGARQCWYEDAASLGMKYDLVNAKGIGGVGIWALGYDDYQTNLWNLLVDKFSGAPADWRSPSSGTSVGLYGAGGRTGLSVVVGANGTILTSDDGDTWQARTSGTSDLLLNADASGPLMVAVGVTGRLLTSPDGITWTLRASTTTNNLRGIAWGSGAYVAVGNSGTILRSTDGITWAEQTSGTSITLQGVCYGNGQFVAVGESGLLLTSPDGIAWTSRTSGTASWLLDVVYGGGQYAAVGQGGVILRSANGASWTSSTSGVSTWLWRVSHGDGRFVVVGDGGLILASTNASAWSPETSGTTNVLRGLAYQGGLFTAAGLNGTLRVRGEGLPSVSITTSPGSVPNSTASLSLSGTANTRASGHLRWVNSLGGAGSIPVAANWSFTAPLVVGTNVITVTASNASGQAASASVSIQREPAGETPSGQASTSAAQPGGALDNIVVYCSAGHGFTGDGGSWITGRGLTYGMVEDMGNLDQLAMFADYCFRAGATVVPYRPIGFQPNEVVLDNTSPGVSFGGTWSDSTSAIFYGAPGAVPYRFAYINTTSATSWAIYRPTIPVSGFYPVYAWTRSGSDRVRQLYRVYHSGGVTDLRVNHRRVGLGWVWLGTYYFNAGTEGSVNISNHAPGENPASDVVIADAIRFGNGMGDINRGSGVSSFERELEASRYWVQNMAGQGMSATLYDLSGYNDNSDNVGAPARMAAEMNRAEDGTIWDRIYLGFHSNADGGAGTARGAMGLYDNRGTTLKQNRQKDFGQLIAREVNQDMEWADSGVLVAEDWVNNSADLYGSAYGELYGTMNDEMNSTIIEVAFHNNEEDAKFLKSPVARRLMAMSSYQAIVKHLATNNPVVPLVLLPEPPTSVRAVNSGLGRVTLSWTAPVTNAACGGAATGYVVYRSTNGYGFGQPVAVGGGASTVTLTNQTAGAVLYFHVAATNRGGESLPSKVVGVRVSPSGRASQLVVNGFERNDRSQTPNRFFANNLNGQVAMVRPRQINSFDYVIQHGQALAAAGRYFDSCDNDAVSGGQVALASYHAAYWILGEESTANETFSSAEQTLMKNFLDAGGNLFVSGAELAWDLDAQGTAADRAFLTNYLRVAYATDSAGTYQAIGKSGTIFNGLGVFSFDDGTGPTYNVGTADTLALRGNPSSVAALVYGSSSAGSVIAGAQFSNAWRTVVLGLPFETILSESARNTIMTRVVGFFGNAPQDAPVLSITSADQSLPSGTASFAVQGTNNAALTGMLTWNNGLTGGNGTHPSSASWTVQVPVAAGTNVITVSGMNFLGTQTAMDTVRVVVASASSGGTGVTNLFQDNFESGTLGGWVSDVPGAWAVSSSLPISGGFSLKHDLAGVASTNAITIQPVYDVTLGKTIWRFILRNGNFDPSSNNRFHVFLMADGVQLKGGAVNGYAVGVNLTGTDDLLKLWRVNAGAAPSVVVASTLDWNANMTVAIEVSRTAGGLWEVKYSTAGTFAGMVSAGTGLDALYTNSSVFGLVFQCTSSVAGALRMDEVQILQEWYPDITVFEEALSVPNSQTTCSISGRCLHASGSIVWTNLTGKTGGQISVASPWALVVTGLAVGENQIRVFASNAEGIRATGVVVIARSPFALGNAWHHPSAMIPGVGAMRSPATPSPGQAVFVYSASQSGGAGNAAQQTGGTLYYRKVGAGSWSTALLSWHSDFGSNTCWRAVIPAGTYASLDVVQYCFELTYSDRASTYVALTAGGVPSEAVAALATAQSRPFTLVYADEIMTPVMFHEDFEAGHLNQWTLSTAGAWTNTAVSPVSETRSLKHNISGLAGTDAICAQPVYSVASGKTLWRFILRNGNFDPSTGNRFHVYLMADHTNLSSTAVNGYAVGVNLTGSDDLLKLWRVTGGKAAATVLSSPLDWNAGMTVAVEVSRDVDGRWELKYSASGDFDSLLSAGQSTDATYINTTAFGLVFVYTSSNAGKLYWDDIRISHELFPKVEIEGGNRGVANAVTSLALSGTCANVNGLLSWTNLAGSSGTAPVAANWTLNVTGLQVGDNVIRVTATNATGTRATGTVTIARSSYVLGNAWHVPSLQVPGGTDTMRSPGGLPSPSRAVSIYVASQAGGSGNAGALTGGQLFHRVQGGAWSSEALAHHTAAGTNVYWKGSIPGGVYTLMDGVEYYLELTYSDRDATYVSLNSSGQPSEASGSEDTARARPFTFTYADESAAPVILDEDFEDGDLVGWIPDAPGAWVNSAVTPINGAYSLKHNLSGVATSSYLYARPTYSLDSARTTWRFILRNGNFDPSSGNRFHVYLMSDREDLRGAVNGYAVGVNLTGTDDLLKLWRVTGGSVASTVVASTLDWNANMTVAVEVTRDADGGWELRYGLTNDFNTLVSAGTGTDATHTETGVFGLYYLCTLSYAGLLRWDDIKISQVTVPSLTIVGVPYRVGNAVTSCSVSGTSAGAVGHVSWTNLTGAGSGRSPVAEHWATTVTGLQVGDNLVRIAVTNVAGGLTTAEVTINRNPYVSEAILAENFEDGDLAGWIMDTPDAWANSTVTPIHGARSLKHNVAGVVTTNYIYAQPSYSVAGTQTIWRFVLKNGSFDPSGSSRFHVYLMADSGNFRGPVNGYAVGVNLTGTDDLLKLWRVTGGAVDATVVASTLDWNANMTNAIEVIRQANGQWELRYHTGGVFTNMTSAGMGTDTTYTDTTAFGLYFQCAASYAGRLFWDSILIYRGESEWNGFHSLVADVEPDAEQGMFSITALPMEMTSDSRTLVWQSREGRIYSIYASTNLMDGFVKVQGSVEATPPLNALCLPALEAPLVVFQIREE